MKQLCIDTKESCLYVHTKGAVNKSPMAEQVRFMWEDEFINHKDFYLHKINSTTPLVVCPFTGQRKTTWWNGFFINYPASLILTSLVPSKKRYLYETLFKNEKNIKVLARIYNDVDDGPRGNLNSESKLRCKKYVADLFTNKKDMAKPIGNNKYLNSPKTISLIFPSNEKKFNGRYDWVKKQLQSNGQKVIDFSNFKFERYNGFPLNGHHFTTDSHFNTFHKEISKALGIDYNLKDFIKVNYKSKKGFDLSYYKPKEEFKFSIEMDGKVKTGDFSVLLGFDMNFPNEYHALFKSSHHSCIINNESVHNNKILLISGDSHNVPLIPILSCFFQTIVYLDNRDKWQMNVGEAMPCGFDYDKYQYTDIIFSFFENNNLNKYIIDNFKK